MVTISWQDTVGFERYSNSFVKKFKTDFHFHFTRKMSINSLLKRTPELVRKFSTVLAQNLGRRQFVQQPETAVKKSPFSRER